MARRTNAIHTVLPLLLCPSPPPYTRSALGCSSLAGVGGAPSDHGSDPALDAAPPSDQRRHYSAGRLRHGADPARERRAAGWRHGPRAALRRPLAHVQRRLLPPHVPRGKPERKWWTQTVSSWPNWVVSTRCPQRRTPGVMHPTICDVAIPNQRFVALIVHLFYLLTRRYNWTASEQRQK